MWCLIPGCGGRLQGSRLQCQLSRPELFNDQEHRPDWTQWTVISYDWVMSEWWNKSLFKFSQFQCKKSWQQSHPTARYSHRNSVRGRAWGPGRRQLWTWHRTCGATHQLVGWTHSSLSLHQRPDSPPWICLPVKTLLLIQIDKLCFTSNISFLAPSRTVSCIFCW